MEELEARGYYSLRDRVFHTIREDILSGKYEQHEELKENTIAQKLCVSRTPVREAIRQLELEGLVRVVPNKGAYVNGFTEKDIRDIYRVRAVLEGLCAEWAVEHITEEEIEKLEENIELAQFYIQKKNYDSICEVDTKFHEILYAASKSRILDHMLLNFHHYVERMRRYSLKTEGRAQKSNEEHQRIVEAIKERNAKQAEAFARQHVKNTYQNIDEYGLKNVLEVSSIYERELSKGKNKKVKKKKENADE